MTAWPTSPEGFQLGDRAGQLPRARLHLLEQPHVVDGDDGLVGEGLTSSIWRGRRIRLRSG